MEDIFEKVKEANPIEDVIEEAGYPLKGAGRYRRSSQHDSLVVDTHNQAFFWNSRNQQGDVITWVQDWKRTDAKGAVEFLARRAGMDEPSWGGGDQKTRLASRAREDAFTVAARVYVKRLRESEEAMAYALGRGWTEETIKKAGLGFTGQGTAAEREAMIQEFNLHEIPLDSPAAVAVLGYEGDVKKWINQHDLNLPVEWVTKKRLPSLPKEMLVYPHVQGGRVRYLSCRSIEGKRHYNLPVALAGARRTYFNQAYSPGEKRCVVVEGQADAISLGQWGIPAVALAGTSADDQLLKAVRRRHDELYIGADNDEAGSNVLHPLGQALGPMARLVRWPMGHKDANDWLQAMTDQVPDDQVGQVEMALANSVTYVEHVCGEAGKLMGAPRKDAVEKAFLLISTMDEVDIAMVRGPLVKSLGIQLREFNSILRATKRGVEELGRRATDDEPEIVETLGGYFDGWLVELTYDPETESTNLAYRDPAGTIGTAAKLDIEGKRFIPVVPNALILQEVVLFPSKLGPKKTTKELVDIIQDFMHRYYDFKGDVFFERLSSYYALFTWVYDCFQVVPYLRALGDYGTGKTQMIFRLGHVCYRLMKTSGASTLSPIFRIISRYRGTLFLDEADFGKSDATVEITKLLNTGYMYGVPMLRSKDAGGGDFDIEPFNVYGPKLIATRELFQDRALESRCLTKEMTSGAVRRGVPRILKRDFYREAREIRNMMLTWRLHTWQEEIEVNDEDFDPGIEDRLNQVTMSLKKLVADEDMKNDVQDFVRQYNNRLILERSQTLEAKVLEALVQIRNGEPELIGGEPFWDLSLQNLADVANKIIDEENKLLDPEAEERRQKVKKDLKPRGAGALIDKKLALQKRKRTQGEHKGRIEIVWDEERIEALCERYGIG